MKKKEQLLIKSLCSFKSEKNIKYIEHFTPEVLGHLFFNRMSAVAYETLRKSNMLNKVNREIRTSLRDSYNKSLEKDISFFECVHELSETLSGCDCDYAMLKGAYLCYRYPVGYRTANDIDLLVRPNDVSKIGKALSESGFKQGYIRNDSFVPATRQEIIESKMTRGETVPYIKEVNLPGMKFLEIDINFSLDFKNGNKALVEELLDRAVLIKIVDYEIKTLNPIDFFIHLCCHLYKEATTLPWIEMKRDMTLYKYCDIYLLLEDREVNVLDVFERAKNLGVEKECAFAIIQTAKLFNMTNDYAHYIASNVLVSDPDFLHRIYDPKTGKYYLYAEKDIGKRFFHINRKKLLKEAEL